VLGERRAYTSDDGTPGWEALEEIVGGLEGGSAVSFASAIDLWMGSGSGAAPSVLPINSPGIMLAWLKMAILLTNPPVTIAAEGLPHKTWTRPEVDVLESTGLFAGLRFELMDGELIAKIGKKRKHVSCTRQTVIALEAVFGADFVNQEAPIDVASADNLRNEPEPDVIVLRCASRQLEANPQPSDVLLVVEIADTTLRHDLGSKAALYARAGILEYWVLDVNARRLHVLREPSAGAYQLQLELEESDSVSPLAKPVPISVASLLV